MPENKEPKSKSMIKASIVGFEQMRELSKAMVETNKALTILSKTFDSSAFRQISQMQKNLKRWQESIAPNLKIAQEIANQQATVIESIRPILENGAIYGAQLNAIVSIAKINFPTFNIPEIITKNRVSIHDCLEKELKETNVDYYKMWDGSWKAVDSTNPDKIRQSANSMRELFRTILHDYSDDTQIRKRYSLKKKDAITRRQRLSFILNEVDKERIKQLDETISHALEVDQEIQKATHAGGEEEKFRNILCAYENFIWMIISQTESIT